MAQEQGASCSDNSQEDEEMRSKVYRIAETIINLSHDLNSVLANIKNVTSVLNKISVKLSNNESICSGDRKLLLLTEEWLKNEELTNGRKRNVKTLAKLVHNPLTNGEQSSISPPGSNQLALDKIEETGKCESREAGSLGGSIASFRELDWDSNGVQLSDSYHSSNGGFSKSSPEMIDFTERHKTAETPEGTIIKTPSKDSLSTCSYDGVYEHDMEDRLERFLADSSFDSVAELVGSDFSPQADSGVANLNSNTSTERSLIVEDDEEPTYNQAINTWDLYGMVVAEDTQSLASSSTSTPRRRRHQSSSSVSINSNSGSATTVLHQVEDTVTSSSDNDCLPPTLEGLNLDVFKSNGTPDDTESSPDPEPQSSDAESRTSDISLCHSAPDAIMVNSDILNSLPESMCDDPPNDFNLLDSDSNNNPSTSASVNNATGFSQDCNSTSQHNDTTDKAKQSEPMSKITLDDLSDGYKTSKLSSLSTHLHKNNYRSRKPVFV